jgi:hypothetical protein
MPQALLKWPGRCSIGPTVCSHANLVSIVLPSRELPPGIRK